MPSRSHTIPTGAFRKFVMIVRRLRRDCPWDRRQTHRSLRHSLLEETYEVIHAIDDDDRDELAAELGDLLLHIIMHATIAEQKGEFTLEDVLEGISRKLVRRHPHVFGTAKARTAGEVKQTWERLKMEEGRSSRLQGIPATLPALQRSLRMQQRAANVGFDWADAKDIWAKVREELSELQEAFERGSAREREEEFGDFLFALVNLARFLKIHPEDALRQTNRKFEQRFRFIERALKAQGSVTGNVYTRRDGCTLG